MMTSFKALGFQLRMVLRILFVLQIFVLASCLRGPSKNPKSLGDTEDATGDFKLLPVEGAAINVQDNAIWTIPTQKTYQFRVCLISRTTNNQLPIGQEFEIVLDDNVRKKVETDNLGCVTWQEVVPFNYAGDSVYIERVREIVGKDVYKGKDTIRLAINPWLEYRGEAGDEVVDLVRYPEKVPEGALESAAAATAALGGLFSNLSNQHLFIESTPVLNIKNTKDLPDGKELEILFQVKPFIQTLKMNKDPHVTRLKNGEFDMYIQLVATYVGPKGKYNMILTPELSPLVDKEAPKIGPDGVLTFKNHVILDRKARGGIIQAAVKIVPRNAPFDLGSYEGLHDVGEFDELLGLKYAQQSKGVYTREVFDYSDFLENQTTNFEEMKKSNWAMKLPPVRYSPLMPRFVRVNGGETATMREITFRTTTVATDSVTGKPLADELFTVSSIDGSQQFEVEATEQGLLRWMDKISHLYYETEKYVFPTVQITHRASESLQNIKIAINPWDYGWTFGDDTRGQEAFYNKLAKRQVRPNRLFIDAFRYQTIRFRYEIDPFMTLNVKKAVVMAMDPLVQRNTIQNGRIFEPLRDGIYLAKVALVKYFVDPFQNGTRLDRDEQTNEHSLGQVKEGGKFETGQYTTVIKKLIRVQAGRITTPLEFSMRDLRMMSIRSQIMVQLETIDERKLLATNQTDAEFRQLFDEYMKLNDPGNTMTEEQRQAFFDEKEALFRAEMKGLRDKMDKELEILRRQRIARGEAQEGQFQIYEQLEKSIAESQPAALRGQYEEIMSLERSEFEEKMQDARDRLREIHDRMDEFRAQSEEDLEEWEYLGFEDGLPPVPLRDGRPPEKSRSAGSGAYSEATIDRRFDKRYGDRTKNHEVLCYDENAEDGVAEECREKGLKFTEETVSYYDYLWSMQTLLDNVGLPATVGESDYKAFELNNYTANPAAPFIDLNIYRNKSGLMRRTFIGPCTLVANANMSEMRPTDTIDEKYCEGIDCSQGLYTPLHPPAENEKFEKAAEHDSLTPFTNMHVDQVIEMHKKNEEAYELTMQITSQLGSYTENFNFDYTSMNDRPIKSFVSGCRYEGSVADFVNDPNCFEEVTNTELSAEKRRIVSADDRVASFNIGDEEMRRLFDQYFELHGWNSLKKLEDPPLEESEVTQFTPYFEQVRRHMSRIKSVDYLTKKVEARDSRESDRRVLRGRSERKIGEYYVNTKLGGEIPEFIENDIDRWLEHGFSELTLSDALRLCSVHAMGAVERLQAADLLTTEEVSDMGLGTSQFSRRPTEKASQIAYERVTQSCLEKFVFLPESGKIFINGFSFDRRWKIHRTGPYKSIAGKNMNLNVGIDFGVSSFSNNHDVVQTGVDVASIAKTTFAAVFGGVGFFVGSAIPGAGNALGLLAGAKAGGLVGAGIGSFIGGLFGNFIFNIAQEDVEGLSDSLSTSVSAATFLVVQKAEMEVRIFEYERCLTTQFTPEFVQSVGQSLGQTIKPGVFRDKEVYEDYVWALSRGIMICDGEPTSTEGEENNERNTIYENWYYVTQHFTAGDMLDEVNLLNHVWLLALRGDRDYNKFIQSLKARPINSEGEEIPGRSLYNYPLYRLGKIYDDVTPSFPGIYTLPD